MRKTIIAGLVHNHVGGSFGSFGRVFRDKPDGEHDAPDFNPLGGDDSDWAHTTTIDGNQLVSLDLKDPNNEDGVFPDEDDDEEESEEAPAPKNKKQAPSEEEEEPEEEEEEDPEEEEEEDPEEEEEEDPEEEEEEPEEEPETPAKKPDVRTPAEKRADSAFKQLRLKEAAYRKAQEENQKPLDFTSINKPLVDERNALIKERAKLDPVASEEDADRVAEIDIQLEDIRTRLAISTQEATAKRNSSTEISTREADKAIQDALAAISSAYPALDSDSDSANEKAIIFFNTMQKGFMEDGKMSLAEALEKATKETVEMFGLRSTKQKLSTKEKENLSKKEARNGVQKRLNAVKKQPQRGVRKQTQSDTSLASLLKRDFGDKEVQSELQAQLGIRFDN